MHTPLHAHTLTHTQILRHCDSDAPPKGPPGNHWFRAIIQVWGPLEMDGRMGSRQFPGKCTNMGHERLRSKFTAFLLLATCQ